MYTIQGGCIDIVCLLLQKPGYALARWAIRFKSPLQLLFGLVTQHTHYPTQESALCDGTKQPL